MKNYNNPIWLKQKYLEKKEKCSLKKEKERCVILLR